MLFADFLQRSGFDRDALQVCCFFKRTLADGLNVFADHNFFSFLSPLNALFAIAVTLKVYLPFALLTVAGTVKAVFLLFLLTSVTVPPFAADFVTL